MSQQRTLLLVLASSEISIVLKPVYYGWILENFHTGKLDSAGVSIDIRISSEMVTIGVAVLKRLLCPTRDFGSGGRAHYAVLLQHKYLGRVREFCESNHIPSG